jgi:hypothetical protein
LRELKFLLRYDINRETLFYFIDELNPSAGRLVDYFIVARDDEISKYMLRLLPQDNIDTALILIFKLDDRDQLPSGNIDIKMRYALKYFSKVISELPDF